MLSQSPFCREDPLRTGCLPHPRQRSRRPVRFRCPPQSQSLPQRIPFLLQLPSLAQAACRRAGAGEHNGADHRADKEQKKRDRKRGSNFRYELVSDPFSHVPVSLPSISAAGSAPRFFLNTACGGPSVSRSSVCRAGIMRLYAHRGRHGLAVPAFFKKGFTDSHFRYSQPAPWTPTACPEGHPRSSQRNCFESAVRLCSLRHTGSHRK